MTIAEPLEFGALIRRFRLASGLSQEQLAERCGLSARAVSDLERGQRLRTRPETLRMLADGLSLAPDEREILLRAARPELTEPAASASAHELAHDLPTPHRGLIGREPMIEEVVTRLRSGTRLVTLTGPGGVGKTRVALEAAQRAARLLKVSPLFIDLSPIANPDHLGFAIAQALGIHDSGERSIRDTLCLVLRHRRTLLLLDNFEQIIDAAPLVAALLEGVSDLRVMVTSRESLRVGGEDEIVVEPLDLPSGDLGALDQVMASPAVQLFVTTAALVDAGFELTEDCAEAVTGICSRLDGLPLAIELAASRVKHFPPALLLERMERRLPVLTGGRRDLPARQQTLRDTIAWSYELLSPEEQALFRRIGAFPGGATLETLDVCSDVAGALGLSLLGGLASLVDKNLVRERMGTSNAPRFFMLETIREFAGEMTVRAGELESSQRAVIAWAMNVVGSGRAGDMAWFLGRANLQQLAEELDNVRFGFEAAAEGGDAESCARIVVSMSGYFYLRGHFQETVKMGRKVLELAEARPLPDTLRGRTLSNHAGFWAAVSDPVSAEQLAREGLEVLQQASTDADAVDILMALTVLVVTIRDQGRYAEALSYAEQAYGLALPPADEPYRIWPTFAIGKLSYLLDDQDRAIRYLGAALDRCLAFGANDFAVHTGNFLAAAHLRRGDVSEAAATLRSVVALWWEAGSLGAGGFLDEAAVLAAASDRPDAAAMLFAADEAQAAQFGMRVDNDPWTAAARDVTRTRLGTERFEALWLAGQRLALEEAVELVLELLDQIEAGSDAGE
jgi:predicted ATPase/DNA-binding XRE family transcriptional regulator